MTISEIWKRIPGIPPAEMWALLNWACNKDVYGKYSLELYPNSLKKLQTALREHYQNKKPISSIVGSCEFYNREYSIKNCLIPRYTTEIILDYIFKWYDKPPKSLIDVGCGSGVIAITCKEKWLNSIVSAIDIDSKALVTSKINSRGLDILWQKRNWYRGIDNFYDLAICNPPYVDQHEYNKNYKSLRHEPYHALVSQNKGLKDLLYIASNFYKYSKDIVLEHRAQQSIAVRTALEKTGRYKQIIPITEEYAKWQIGTLGLGV